MLLNAKPELPEVKQEPIIPNFDNGGSVSGSTGVTTPSPSTSTAAESPSTGYSTTKNLLMKNTAAANVKTEKVVSFDGRFRWVVIIFWSLFQLENHS